MKRTSIAFSVVILLAFFVVGCGGQSEPEQDVTEGNGTATTVSCSGYDVASEQIDLLNGYWQIVGFTEDGIDHDYSDVLTQDRFASVYVDDGTFSLDSYDADGNRVQMKGDIEFMEEKVSNGSRTLIFHFLIDDGDYLVAYSFPDKDQLAVIMTPNEVDENNVWFFILH